MKKTLILNSHTLSDYQRCPQRFQYTHERRLEPRERKLAFDKGSVISTMLQHYYNLKINQEVTPRLLMDICASYLTNAPGLTQEEKEFIEIRFLQYYKFYRNETWIPITTEIGFSKILYEDSEYLFTYEGRPDLFAWLNSEKKTKMVGDHKSQARRYDYYPFNNQALGYCWATDSQVFVYNYFGLQETGKPDEWFRRTSKVFQPFEIEQWKLVTIEWCKRIVNDSRYDKSWQCQNGWGVCEYSKLCEAPYDFVKADIANRFYQISTYRSW